MNQHRCERQRAHATYIYALLLRLYPRAYQQALGDQMLQTFQDHYRDAVEAGVRRAIAFWLEVAADEGKSVLRERIAALVERNPSVKKLLLAIWEPLTVVAALALLIVLIGLGHLNNVAPLLLAIPISQRLIRDTSLYRPAVRLRRDGGGRVSGGGAKAYAAEDAATSLTWTGRAPV